jgi:hypothetical protein
MTSLIGVVRLDVVDSGVRCYEAQWIIMVLDRILLVVGANAR